MLRPDQIDEAMAAIAAMGREELVRQFRTYPAPFPIDFTDEFLRQQPLDKLRHVFAGLVLHTGQMPALPSSSCCSMRMAA